MNRKVVGGIFWSLVALVAPNLAAAEAVGEKSEAKVDEAKADSPAAAAALSYAVLPEGKTLPAGVARFRLPYTMSTSKNGYDKDGNKVDSGFRLKAAGGAAVVEYGLLPHVTVQVLTKFTQKFEVSMDTAEFKRTQAFTDGKKQAYAKSFGSSVTNADSAATAIKTGIAGNFLKAGLCSSLSACVAAIDGGLKAPAAIDLTSAGLTGQSIKAGDGINDTVKAIVNNAIDPKIEDAVVTAAKSNEKTGAKGIGDTEIGVLYEAVDTAPVFLSVGGGFRLPTGKCKSLGIQEQSNSRCVSEFGLRTNVDLLPVNSFMVSWQNQAEVMVAPGKRDINADSLATVKRKGVRQVGYVYLKPSLAGINPTLGNFAPRFGVNYDYDSGEVVNNVAAARGVLYQSYAALSYDFLPHGVPLQLDLEHFTPIKGRDKTFAPTTDTTTLKVFARF